MIPLWRPEPLTSLTDSEGNPSTSSSARIGSKASWRMYAITIFMRFTSGQTTGRLRWERTVSDPPGRGANLRDQPGSPTGDPLLVRQVAG